MTTPLHLPPGPARLRPSLRRPLAPLRQGLLVGDANSISVVGHVEVMAV
nr:hypothetical protein OH837_14650 [Streptomyces canus]